MPSQHDSPNLPGTPDTSSGRGAGAGAGAGAAAGAAAGAQSAGGAPQTIPLDPDGTLGGRTIRAFETPWGTATIAEGEANLAELGVGSDSDGEFEAGFKPLTYLVPRENDTTNLVFAAVSIYFRIPEDTGAGSLKRARRFAGLVSAEEAYLAATGGRSRLVNSSAGPQPHAKPAALSPPPASTEGRPTTQGTRSEGPANSSPRSRPPARRSTTASASASASAAAAAARAKREASSSEPDLLQSAFDSTDVSPQDAIPLRPGGVMGGRLKSRRVSSGLEGDSESQSLSQSIPPSQHADTLLTGAGLSFQREQGSRGSHGSDADAGESTASDPDDDPVVRQRLSPGRYVIWGEIGVYASGTKKQTRSEAASKGEDEQSFLVRKKIKTAPVGSVRGTLAPRVPDQQKVPGQLAFNAALHAHSEVSLASSVDKVDGEARISLRQIVEAIPPGARLSRTYVDVVSDPNPVCTGFCHHSLESVRKTVDDMILERSGQSLSATAAAAAAASTEDGSTLKLGARYQTTLRYMAGPDRDSFPTRVDRRGPDGPELVPIQTIRVIDYSTYVNREDQHIFRRALKASNEPGAPDARPNSRQHFNLVRAGRKSGAPPREITRPSFAKTDNLPADRPRPYPHPGRDSERAKQGKKDKLGSGTHRAKGTGRRSRSSSTSASKSPAHAHRRRRSAGR